MSFTPEQAKKLGIIGTINYIGAILIYTEGLFVPNISDIRRLVLGLAGTGLIIFSGILHNNKVKIEPTISKIFSLKSPAFPNHVIL